MKHLEKAKKETPAQSQLTLKSPNGKHEIALVAGDTGPGIWLTNGERRTTIAIYSIEGNDGAVVGIYGDTDKANNGVTICIATDKNGDPFFQLVAAERRRVADCRLQVRLRHHRQVRM